MITNEHYKNRPYLGYGLGLRKQHYETVLAERPDVLVFQTPPLKKAIELSGPLEVHWQHRTAGFRLPETTQSADQTGGTGMVFRPPVLDRCKRPQPARLDAITLYRRSDTACRRPRQPGTGLYGPADVTGECLQLCQL